MQFTPRRVVLASMAVWFLCVVTQWLIGPPLSSDEAAYAILARDGQTIWLYRPIGTIAIAQIALFFGTSEHALRVPSVVLGMAFPLGLALLGNRFGRWTGAWAVALIVTSHTFLMRGFQLLNDLPAGACLLVTAAVLIDELDRPGGPTYRLVWCAPLCAMAIYLRYGAVLVVATFAGVALLVWWRSLLRHPWPVLAAVLLLVLLLAPLAAYSHARTGTLLGVFEIARERATFSTGQGLHRFLLSNPFLFYGALLPPIMLVGIAGVVLAPGPERRRTIFVVLLALAMVIWLGLFSDGSARFLFVAIAFLVIAGVRGVALGIARHRVVIRALAGLVVAGWLTMLVVCAIVQRTITERLGDVMVASAAIRQDAAGRPCYAIARNWLPQLMWYSGCQGVKAHSWTRITPSPPEARWYAVSMPGLPVEVAPLLATVHASSATPLDGGAYLLAH